MQVYGAPNTNFNITVTSLAPIPYSVTMNITFDYCPPGYIAYKKGKYDNSTSCKCGDSHSDGIPGISDCNETLYRAYITRYKWGGIHEPSGKFVTAMCPQDYCTFAKSKYNSLLPRKRSDLDSFQCQDQYRTGDICGECMSSYSISSQSNCIKCTHGILKGLGLFFAYKCLPTILFVSIILFLNINIASGHWNSLIFYFQVVEVLNLYALQSTEEYSEGFQIVINIHKYAFGIWNLEFYSPDVCYISGIKNVFGLYALHYATVIIAFGLGFVLFVIKNLPCTKKCKGIHNNQQNNRQGIIEEHNDQEHVEQNGVNIEQNAENNVEGGFGSHIKNKFKKWWGSKSQLIHGLTTVVVLTYTKIALLSMKFFVPGPMYVSYHEKIDTRVHLVGTMKYGQGDHLYYVFPALVLLGLAGLVPCYLILKSFTARHEDEWCRRFDRHQRCKTFDDTLYCCVNKAKGNEFLDEFYTSFNKNCRYYAGLFFIYRLALYATFAFTPSLMIQYCVQQCLLGFFLFVHSVLQPYNEHFPFANKLDALIFMKLIVINAVSTILTISTVLLIFKVNHKQHLLFSWCSFTCLYYIYHFVLCGILVFINLVKITLMLVQVGKWVTCQLMI